MSHSLRKPKLPDELVANILAEHLAIPFDRFNSDDEDKSSPFNAPDHLSTSAALLVCKQWLRVATPLLYDTVTLRTDYQSMALDNTLDSNPSLVKFIRRLRLEGPYGTTLERIALGAPENLKHLCLSFTAWAWDDHTNFVLDVLIESLPLLNPTTLNVNVGWKHAGHYYERKRCPRSEDRIRELKLTIARNLTKWTNLTSVYFTPTARLPCFVSGCGHTQLSDCNEGFAAAIGDASTVEAFHLAHGPYDFPSKLVTLVSKNSTIRKINLRPTRPPYDPWPKFIGGDAMRMQSIIYVHDRSLQEVIHEKDRGLSPMACALATGFDDSIWCRILECRMDLESDFWDAHRAVKQFRLVCNKFQILGMPYLYKESRLTHEGSPGGFLRHFLGSTSSPLHIKSFILDAPEDRDSWYSRHPEQSEAIAKIMRLLPNLKVLDRSSLDDTDLRWEAFEAICETSAENMTVFRPTGIYRVRKDSEPLASIPVTVFQAFKNITRLRWCSQWVKFDTGCDVPPEIFSSLVELEYEHMAEHSTPLGVSLIAMMSYMDLPALRTLLLSGNSCPIAAQFLQRHGMKITTLRLDAYCAEDPGSLLRCCPSLTRLAIDGRFRTWNDMIEPMCQSFSSEMRPLQTLSISLTEAPGAIPHPMHDPYDPFWLSKTFALDAKQARLWSKFLDPALFVGFPALHGISVEQIMWPETQDEMWVNYWPTLSAQLMTANIKLMDKDGRFWVPRMGDRSFSDLPNFDSEEEEED